MLNENKKTNKHRKRCNPKIPIRQKLVILISMVCLLQFFGTVIFADDSKEINDSQNIAAKVELEKITIQLETLNASRKQLLEDKEDLQIELWGKSPEEYSKSERKRLDSVTGDINALDNRIEQLRQEKKQLQIQLGEVVEDDEEYEDEDDLLDISLVDLMNLEIEPVGTLTRTTRRMVPAAVTTLTREQIWSCGAHSLNELLEIYIPNLQYGRQDWEAPHLGMRGIINDRDDKYLMLVNGKVMNERTHYGALSERDLPLFGDIHHIDVVRGPGSAIYGPGAVSMVVNIVTDNAMTFEGTQIISKLGAIDEFYSAEIKHGRKFDDGSGLFVYVGADQYFGADGDDAPWIFGSSFNVKGTGPDDNWWEWWDWGAGQPAEVTRTPSPYRIEKGKPAPMSINGDGQAYNNDRRYKFHVQYTKDNFDIWARYTRGGQHYLLPRDILDNENGWWPYAYWQGNYFNTPYENIPKLMSGTGYQQTTVYGSYKHELDETTAIDYALSYDKFYYERLSWGSNFNDSAEEKIYSKILVSSRPNERHSFAVGGEASYEKWGGDNFNTYQMGRDDWSTMTFSGMAEWQWNITDKLTSFIGYRIDRNTYTHNMHSPRGAIVYTPNEKDTFKFMATKSVRMTNAEELRHKHLGLGGTGRHGRPEEIDNFELRYERQHSENQWFAVSIFHSKLDVVSWSGSTTDNVGVQKHWGIEGEYTYKKGKFELNASHGYVKLLDFTIGDPSAEQYLSAHPYDFGYDLANWANHISKIQVKYDVDPKWTIDGSARIYWGFPGAKDFAEYAESINTWWNVGYASETNTWRRDGSWDSAYGPSFFVNLGVEHKPCKDMTIRFDGTNLMGFIDFKYNKRLITQGNADSYRSTAPSFIVSVKYEF